MIVIADSSALVAVATYRGLDLLESLFGNGLETMGSLGLLLLAKDEGLITEITSRVRSLQHSNAYLNPLLIEQVLQRAGE